MGINARQVVGTNEAASVGNITLEAVITELRRFEPLDRLLALYELGLDGCVAKDGIQVATVLDELIASLDFQYADIAESFRRLYRFCHAQVLEGTFDRVAFVFGDLRQTLQQTAAERDAVEKRAPAPAAAPASASRRPDSFSPASA